MSRISTSVGPVSGLDWGSIVDKLMAVERRPLEAYQDRVGETTAIKTAFVDLSASLTALQLSAEVFKEEDYFSTATAASSDTSVMNVSVTGSPALASHTFYVDRLVRAHHVVSQGYETANESAVGGTSLTIELGDSGLEKDTALGFLNGQEGIERGSIRVTDRSGSSVIVDLSAAVKVTDVLNAINTQTDANVTASISEQGFVITDNTGQSGSDLKVENVGLTETATSLGIADNVAANTITGSAVNYVSTETSVSGLNRGLGLRSAAG